MIYGDVILKNASIKWSKKQTTEVNAENVLERNSARILTTVSRNIFQTFRKYYESSLNLPTCDNRITIDSVKLFSFYNYIPKDFSSKCIFMDILRTQILTESLSLIPNFLFILVLLIFLTSCRNFAAIQQFFTGSQFHRFFLYC